MSTSEKKEPKEPLGGPALWAALVVLAAFALLVGYLLVEIDSDEVRWSRLAWIFASVEAIAFGAAGALFGSSIQRQRAERAEEAAAENAQAAANGKALAEALKADDTGAGAAGASGLESLGPGDRAAAGVAARHAELARRLFP